MCGCCLEEDYDDWLLFSFDMENERVDSVMIELEDDEYDSDADLYALDDGSVPDYEIGIDFSGFGAVGTFVSEDKGQGASTFAFESLIDGGGNGGKSGGFGGGNGVGFLSESDEEDDDMESLLSNG
ncbi:MAG: hypothetical protein EZS28_041377 [Streblomastix strix]|uniref:Uncharacterized protein n=1 Tax=Streblomastix strix TaxID=222440 RepID=A0A5J4TX80_9EUKA|nr:MAG: hypothetical protein EZS28_041377 [Streblomastix strix]